MKLAQKTIATLALAAIVVSARAEAQSDLASLRDRLKVVDARLAEGAAPVEVATEINRLYEEQRLRLERLRARLENVERKLQEKGIGGVAENRLAAARSALEASHGAILEALGRLRTSPNRENLEALLAAVEPLARAGAKDVLSAQDLPLRAPPLSAPPLTKSGVTDTAALAGAGEPDAQAAAAASPAIEDRASNLDGPVAVFEWVKNNTRFELYFGAMKGAEQTLLEGRGNDADINALLVEMLRAKGVPARFVQGVIRLPVETAQNLLGVDLPERVEQALTAAAVPYEPILSGSGLVAVELEHIWVEAYVPYSNYRGAKLDDQGKTWIPLDASFKAHVVEPGVRVLEAMSFDAEAFVRESLAADGLANPDPLATLRQRVTDYLAATQPGMTYEAALRRVELQPEVLGLLPPTLPYDVVSVNAVYFELPDELTHQVELVARTESGEVLLGVHFPASRLLGRRLTVSYVPATTADRETTDAFGGLYSTPPFLVDVRPVLRSGGLVVATGDPIGMGLPFQLSVGFFAPAGTLSFENRVLSGVYAAIALSGRGPTFSEPSETRAGEILGQRALNYLERWNAADDELSALTRVVTLRPVPSHVMVKNHVEVEYAAESGLVPLSFDWKGLDVDADLRPSAPVSAEDEDGARRTFFLLSGLIGSDLESRVLEDDLSVAAVSTSRLLRLARTLGVDVLDVESTNVDQALERIQIDAELEDGIRTHVHLGRHVLAPVRPVSFRAWSGAGFVATDQETGEAAYLLSGAIAGGSTADPPEAFPPNVRDALTDPEESQDEPSRAVAALRKVPESDFQETRVATEVTFPLAVWVTDAEGKPVADGVAVTFRALDAGSVLASMDGAEQGSVVTVPTEGGIARARFVAGASTRARSRFVLDGTGPFATQVGLYTVSADVGSIVLPDPFSVFAFPDDEVEQGTRHARVRLVAGRHSVNQPLIIDAVPLWVVTVDRFGNPLSNLEVTYTVKPPERFGAGPLPEEFTNAKIVTPSGEFDSAVGLTGSGGIAGFVRLGDVDATRYFIDVGREDTKYPDESSVRFARDASDFGAGSTRAPVGERLGIFFEEGGLRLPNNEHLWMGRAGSRLPGTIRYHLRAYQESFKVEQNAEGKYELVGTGRFSTRPVDHGSVEPVLLVGDGVFDPGVSSDNPEGFYDFRFFLGPEPGRRSFSPRIQSTLKQPTVNPDTGDVSFQEFQLPVEPSAPGNDVFGVRVSLGPQQPDPIFIDANGHVDSGTQIRYEIQPPEVETMIRSTIRGLEARVYQDGALRLFATPPAGSVELDPHVAFDPAKVYEAEMALLPERRLELLSEKTRLRFFNVVLRGTKPSPIALHQNLDPDPNKPPTYVTLAPVIFLYFVEPSPVSFVRATVVITEIDRSSGLSKVVAELDGDRTSGEGQAVLAQGFVVDPLLKEYRAEVVLTQVGGVERRSAPLVVPFQRLLFDVSPEVLIQLEIDVLNQICFLPRPITYRLDRDADVLITAIVDGVEKVMFQGRQPASTATQLQFFPPSSTFPPREGQYVFRIIAQAAADPGLVETFEGVIKVVTVAFRNLPVGRTFVKGVDLLDGHLVSSSLDVRIPGRGPALEVARTYGSTGSSDEGPLGAGWTLNYHSTLIITDCFYTVLGGDGTGQRFTREGDQFKPQKGYHTELRQNQDGSFDFFTKGRVRYHYVDREAFEGDRLFGGRPTLEFIEDPNGNRIHLLYDTERNLIEAREEFERGAVTGRSLRFEYTRVLGVPRLSRITGPLGLEIRYEYDAFANLIRATRDERVETYEYSVGNVQDRHNLVAYTDPNGNRTRYVSYQEGDVFPGETPDFLARGKFEWVKEVLEPEGATTSFLYDLRPRGGDVALETAVTDPRGNTTLYRLNLLGSPLRVQEPGPDGPVVTTMEWATDDIVKIKETDALGRVTEFEYDGKANLKKETMKSPEQAVLAVMSYEYDPTFNKMTLKVDAENRRTVYDIDPANGNLRSMTDAERNQASYEYLPNGDLQTVTGPVSAQGDGTDRVTRYTRYDDFGNPEAVVDPLGNETRRTYDVRSRLLSSDDDFGRSMSQEYDGLDRVKLMRRSDAKGSSAEEVVTRTYFAGGQMKTETNGLGLLTEISLDGLNRVRRQVQSGARLASPLTAVMDYDRNGNLTLEVDRRGVRTESTYDSLNRRTRVEVNGAFGSARVVSERGYDNVGNKTFERDLHGHQTDFVYDGLYRVTKKTFAPVPGPTGPVRYFEEFEYDRVGNKLSEKDANGIETLFAYDGLNRAILRSAPEQNVMRFEYDEASNQTLQEDVTRRLRTETDYDPLNRPKLQRLVGDAPDAFTYETTFAYDDRAHTIVETDPVGFKKTTVVDGFDRVHEMRQEVERGGRELTAKSLYDANGNRTRTVDAENRETSHVYDELNRLLETTYPLSPLKMSYVYDGEGNKTNEVNRRGLRRHFRYDNLSRLTATVIEHPITGKPDLTLSRITYDDVGNRRTEQDARGFSTVYEMDGMERVLRIVDADGFAQNFTHDGVNKRSETDKLGRRTAFDHDGLNRLVRMTDARQQVVTTEYLDSARQVRERDRRSLVKLTQLDALGRTVSVTRSGILLEQHGYDGKNNRIRSVDANGNATVFDYDGANRLLTRTEGFGTADQTATTFTYDNVANLLTEKDGRVTGKRFDVQNTYDALNRLKTVEDGEGNVTTYEYDGEGNRTAMVEPKTNRTEYKYGELNELIEVKAADEGVFEYLYDDARNRIEQIDAEGRKVAYSYDRLNRMKQMIQDPGGFRFATTHDYDANGNEVKLTDAKNRVTTFEYDELNRLKAKVYTLPTSEFALFTRTHRIDYQYDPNNNTTRVDETRSSGTDPPAVFTTTMAYDGLDRLDFEIDSFGRKLDYGYDDQGNRTSLLDPDQKETRYTYDALNRLKTLTTDPGTPDAKTTTYTYFLDSLKQQVTQPNGTSSSFGYDAADRLTTITHSGPPGIVSSFTYRLDANSNRVEQIETNAGRTETTAYTYDPVDRLKTVKYPASQVVYAYDRSGNRTTELESDNRTSGEIKNLTYTYDAVNRLTTITDNRDAAQSVAYQYDANGNQTSKAKAGVETKFLFDIRNQLGEVQQGASILGRYGYDYGGRRILKIGGEGRRHYTYDQKSVVTETDQAGATVLKYDYGLDQLVSLRHRNEGRSFYHLDALGSTTNLTTDTGSTRESLFYNAWGEERDRIGSSTNHFTFTGHEIDRETGLIYAKARFYDPEIGRFLSQDPLLGDANEPPSLHRYFYALANPLRFLDPTGRESEAANWGRLTLPPESLERLRSGEVHIDAARVRAFGMLLEQERLRRQQQQSQDFGSQPHIIIEKVGRGIAGGVVRFPVNLVRGPIQLAHLHALAHMDPEFAEFMARTPPPEMPFGLEALAPQGGTPAEARRILATMLPEQARLFAAGVTSPSEVVDAARTVGAEETAAILTEASLAAYFIAEAGAEAAGARPPSSMLASALRGPTASEAAAPASVLGRIPEDVAARSIALAPRRVGGADVSYVLDDAGLTVRAEGGVTGPHTGRGKGYRPEPVGGRVSGEHRGHLIPEGGVENPRLVNVRENIISESATSNLGPKKAFDNLASRVAAQNPNSAVRVVAEPLRRGETRPFAVTYWIEMDGVRIHGQTIFNK